MGRKERGRMENNEKARAILEQDIHTEEEIQFLKNNYSGIGGLTPNDWSKGQFFTPPVVTNFIVEGLGIQKGRILEPSCGAGAFFEPLPAACDVVGIEQQMEASKVAGLCYPNATIIQGDALQQEFDEKFDYVIGNPPYSLKVQDWDFLDNDLKVKSQYKSEVAFVEYGLKQLKPGGILAMVLPVSVLGIRSHADWRDNLLSHHRYIGTVDLPSPTFYHAGTSVKTSIVFIQKGLTEGLGNYPIFMGIVEDIGWDTRGRKTEKITEQKYPNEGHIEDVKASFQSFLQDEGLFQGTTPTTLKERIKEKEEKNEEEEGQLSFSF